jgi:hypothetical protein
MKAQDTITLRFEVPGAGAIMLKFRGGRMGCTIGLNDELLSPAHEICDVGTGGRLPYELVPIERAVAQLFPHALLGQGFLATQASGREGFLAFAHQQPLISPIAPQWVPFFSR